MSTSIAIFIGILVIISSLLAPKRRKRYRNKYRERQELFQNKHKREAEIAVTTFDKKKLFNKGEYIALRYTNKYFADNKLNYYIFPQVPLMAFLDESDSNINIHAGLRPDFVIVNSAGDVVAVMEINGKGHRHKFDTSKFMILESVGIAVINVDTTTWNKSESYGKYVAAKVHAALNDHFFNEKSSEDIDDLF